MKTSHRIKSVDNERGAIAVLSVIIMSFVVVTTLTTVYIYLVNRTKYHSRIREAYQLSHVMEDFGKLTRNAYDVANSTTGANCPSGIAKANTEPSAGRAMCFPSCATAVTAAAAAACDANIGNMCVTYSGKDFCLGSIPNNTAALELNDSNKQYATLMITEPGKVKSQTSLSRWYARLDRFFDSTVTAPVQNFSHDHLLPVLNAQIQLPSALKWMEREFYAYAEPSTAVEDCNSASTPNCLKYCQAQPGLPACTGVQALTITTPVCPNAGDARCQSCVGGECLQLGYCLGSDCVAHPEMVFTQSVRLVTGCTVAPFPVWSDWNTCTKICGSGTQTRTRTCVIEPGCPGMCAGPDTETQVCNEVECDVNGNPVDGGYGIDGGSGIGTTDGSGSGGGTGSGSTDGTGSGSTDGTGGGSADGTGGSGSADGTSAGGSSGGGDPCFAGETPLTFVSLTPSSTSPYLVGIPITISATISGGVPPYQYKWWVDSGENNWSLLSDWSSSSSYAWTPPSASSSWRIGVWVRNAGCLTNFDSVNLSTSFIITNP